jgi:succinate dehydrogenase/fumarate reductase flavoprotein subunit
MGNSLLDIFVFGRRAGIAAANKMDDEPGNVTLDHVHRYYDRLKALRISSVAKAPTLFPEFIVNKL